MHDPIYLLRLKKQYESTSKTDYISAQGEKTKHDPSSHHIFLIPCLTGTPCKMAQKHVYDSMIKRTIANMMCMNWGTKTKELAKRLCAVCAKLN
jgi:hypothetical protein